MSKDSTITGIIYTSSPECLDGDLNWQLESAMRYAQDRNIEITDVFREKGNSPIDTESSPLLDEALEIIKNKKANNLIVYSIENLSLDLADFFRLQEELTCPYEAKILSVKEPYLDYRFSCMLLAGAARYLHAQEEIEYVDGIEPIEAGIQYAMDKKALVDKMSAKQK
ncbi:recombinase family protein [Patescibacteria group bacterium]|nr:recombinase family protein [Patescibacteria group bacterium]